MDLYYTKEKEGNVYLTYKFADIARLLGVGQITLYNLIQEHNIYLEVEEDYLYIDENSLDDIVNVLEKNGISYF